MKTTTLPPGPITVFLPPLKILILLVGLMSIEASAQTPENKAGTAEIRQESLQAKINALGTRQDLDEALKNKILKHYQSALDNINATTEFNYLSIHLQKSLQQAPDKIKKLQKEIEQLQRKLSKQETEEFSHIPIEELEQRLIIEKGRISNLDQQIKKLETLLSEQNNRPQLIRQEIVNAKQDLDATQKKLEIPPSVPESKLEAEARQSYLRTLIDSRSAELNMLEIEAASNTVRVEALKTELQVLSLQKSLLNPIIVTIENTLSERRMQEAREMQEALDQAERELSGKHPVIQTIARENIQYSRDLQVITGKIEKNNEQKSKIDVKSAEIETDFKSAERKISLAGLSPALGNILRKQRRNLPTYSQFSLQSQTIQNETSMASLEQFKVEDRLRQLADTDSELNRIMNFDVDNTLASNERMMIQAELRVLLDNQKDILNRLSIAYTTYLRALGDFDFAQQQMLGQADKFAFYLDEHLLWVPSSSPIDEEYIVGLLRSVQWLLSPLNLLTTGKDLVKTAYTKPLSTAIPALLFLLLFKVKNAIKQQLRKISEKVGKIYTDHFSYTLIALGDILLLAIPAPLLIFSFGWLLANNPNAEGFSQSVGMGLQAAAISLFLLAVFYRFFAPDGVACKHFQWQEKSTTLLRGQIAWIRFIVVPCMFLIYLGGEGEVSVHHDNLGRIAVIITMLTLTIFLSKTMKPSDGLVQDYLEANPNGLANRLRYVWYAGLIAIPMTVIGFAVAGYYLSALELHHKLIVTLRLIFFTVILRALVLRWLTLANRQLALKNARQKRKVAAETQKHAAGGSEDPIVIVEDELLDIPKINEQTKTLLNVFIGFALIVGFWMIWRNILPAFSFLDNITLWHHLATMDNQETIQPITLTNLFLAGLYVFIVIVAVRNFSGVMELLVFRHLSVEAGSRYAINHLAKYTLISIGFVIVANELGGSWSQVQWLVAALSVGLGFGLQEIFANMVSGIILLFERPIRIGDTVTIGDISGKVSRIQMRATTLVDWDQKELIVPNKTFITGQMINWTLTDPITRVVIPVRIAHGSDIESVHKIMLDTVRSIPLILEDPEPSILMLGFGDSSLDFSVRIYVKELGHRLPATHDFHVRLSRAFKEHDIKIPFPQRDIHVRSIVGRPAGVQSPISAPKPEIPVP